MLINVIAVNNACDISILDDIACTCTATVFSTTVQGKRYYSTNPVQLTGLLIM